MVTGLGDDELDLRMHTTRVPSHQRSTFEYEQEKRCNPLANREVCQVAGDMFREGFDLVNVEPKGIDVSSIKSWIEGNCTPNPDGSIDRTLGLLYYLQKLIETGDTVGGAALYAIVDDGLDPAYPLDHRRIRRVVAWEILDRSELIPYVTDGMGTEPEYWMLADVLTSARVGKDGKVVPLRPGQVIHRSRLARHKGVELSRREERVRQWWGDSELELNWNARRAVEEGTEYANTILCRSGWLHYSFADLNETIQLTEKDTERAIGRELVRERMLDFRRMTSTLGIGVTDGGHLGSVDENGNVIEGRSPDKVEQLLEKTGDLVPIVQLNLDQWQSGWGAPRSIAFGEQSSAMRGGDNKGDWQSWQGTIDYKRKRKHVDEHLTWMLTITFASHQGPTHGLIPTQWDARWRSLIVPSAKEKAEIAELQAKADNTRIEKGVAKADEVRLQRLVQGDVEGQLKAAADESDLDSAIQPAQVGVARAMLDGGMAVAAGQVSEEWYGEYLQSIDKQRFPTGAALRMAKAAAAPRPQGQADAPVDPDTGGGSSPSAISAATLLNAGGQIAQGKLAPEFLSATVQHLDPANFSPAVAEHLVAAALGGAPTPTPAPAIAVASAPEPTVDAEVTDDTSSEASERMPEVEGPDALDVLLAEIPDDLMSPTNIAAEIKRRTNLDVSTQRIHKLADRHKVGRGNVGGAMGYSFLGIREALAKENGLELPGETVSVAPVDDERNGQ